MSGNPLTVTADLLLADWAEAIGGKLYAQGAGWTLVLPETPIQMALAALVHIPYSNTNTRYHVVLGLVTEDGRSYPTDTPFQLEADLEVGRPVGMLRGEESIVPLAVRLGGVMFDSGAYRFEARIEDQVIGQASFVARKF